MVRLSPDVTDRTRLPQEETFLCLGWLGFIEPEPALMSMWSDDTVIAGPAVSDQIALTPCLCMRVRTAGIVTDVCATACTPVQQL